MQFSPVLGDVHTMIQNIERLLHQCENTDTLILLEMCNSGFNFTSFEQAWETLEPKEEAIPTPSMCYRFVLSNPHVDVCLTAPSNLKHLEENLKAVRQGPLCEEEMQFMRTFGDAVRHRRKWFT